MLQRHAIQILHGDERLAVLLVYFVDRADVGMVQCRSGLGFALKTGQSLGVLRYFVGQEFQGYEAMELDVLGLVHNTHSTTAQLLDDAIVRDGLADHGIEPC